MPPLRILGQSQAHYCYDNRLKLPEQRGSNPSLRSPMQDNKCLIKPMRIRLLRRTAIFFPDELYSDILREAAEPPTNLLFKRTRILSGTSLPMNYISALSEQF